MPDLAHYDEKYTPKYIYDNNTEYNAIQNLEKSSDFILPRFGSE